MGYDTDTKNFRVGDDTAQAPKILTNKTEAFDLSNLKDLTLSVEVLDLIAKRGIDGWTPVLGTQTSGDRELLVIRDWSGGEGVKPEYPLYVTATGLSTDINLATNIKGSKGQNGSAPVISFSIENGVLKMAVMNPDNTMGPVSSTIDEDGHLILEYSTVEGTSVTTDLGKVLIRYIGNYDPDQVYEPLDEVTVDNKLYRVRFDSESVQGVYVTNTNHWSLVFDYLLDVGTELWAVQVDNLDDRDAYDNEDVGTSVLVSDVGNGKAAVFSRIGAAGNWTNPAYLTGPEGNTYDSYGVSVYKPGGVDLGGYYAERNASSNSIQTRLFAEILSGSPGSSVVFYIDVGGVAYGQYEIVYGYPVNLTDLNIPVSIGDSVTFFVTYINNVDELFIKLGGKIVNGSGSGDFQTAVKRFTGNNSATVFDTEIVEATTNLTSVYINGVYQQKDSYTLVNGVITFSEAPSSSHSIEAVIIY